MVGYTISFPWSESVALFDEERKRTPRNLLDVSAKLWEIWVRQISDQVLQ